MTSSLEPFVQIQNNFTELFILTTLYQNCTNGYALLNKGAIRALAKKYLHKISPPEPLLQIQTKFSECFLNKRSTRAPDKKYLKTTSLAEPLVQIQKKIHRTVPHDAFYRNCTNSSTPKNKGAARALDNKCLLMTFLP